MKSPMYVKQLEKFTTLKRKDVVFSKTGPENVKAKTKPAKPSLSRKK